MKPFEHQRRQPQTRPKRTSTSSDECALNRIPEQCTITGGPMSGLRKNGDKCSHSESRIGHIVLFELQICEDYSRIAQKTDLAARSEIVIGRSGVQCERL